jgi:hypothetical protein
VTLATDHVVFFCSCLELITPPHFLSVNADFLKSLEGLDGNQLLTAMHSFLSKGIAAGRKGYE